VKNSLGSGDEAGIEAKWDLATIQNGLQGKYFFHHDFQCCHVESDTFIANR